MALATAESDLTHVWTTKLWVSILFLIFLCIPVVLKDQYIIRAFIQVLLYAFLTLSWNIVGGFAGQLSIGHSIFTGIGAYTSALLLINFGISPWVGMLAGGLLASFASVIIGFPCFRLRGAYFVLVTIAVAELIMNLVINTETVFGLEINGGRGILIPMLGNSPLYFQFLNNAYYYYIILFLLAIGIYISYKIKNSKLGFYLLGLKDNQDAAESLGVNSTKYKLIAFAISAYLTGLGGVFYAQFLMFISPQRIFGLGLSFEMVILGIVGGSGTITGPVLGAFLLRPIAELTQIFLGGSYGGVHLIVYSLILMSVIFYFPQGIAPLVSRLWKYFLRNIGMTR